MNAATAFPMGDGLCADMVLRATEAPGERAKELAEKLRAYLRGKPRKRSAIDLCASVARAMEAVRDSLPAGIELQPQLPADPVHVVADTTEVHHIVLQLCSNASRAIAGRGTIDVEVSSVASSTDGRFPGALLAPGAYAMLKVRDTGCGMDSQTAARIFAPPIPREGAVARGLSLVRAIVTDLGGAIEVATKPGRGTMLTIWLPAAEPAQPRRLANDAPPRSRR